MTRRPAIAGAVCVVAVAAAAWLASARSDRPAQVAAHTAARAIAPDRIRLGPTSPYDLSRGVALAVRVRVPAADRPTVRAAVAAAGRRPVSLSRPVAVPARTVRQVALEPRPGVSRTLGACRSHRLDVAVRDAHGRLLSRRSRTLEPEPPRCGRFFGAASAWNRPLAASGPLDPLSETLVADLHRQVQDGFARNFPPTINTVSYSAPVYTATVADRRVPVQLVGQRRAWGGQLARVLQAGVPIPAGARAAWGSDHHLVIWQPSTDTMWELWGADDSHGRWEAAWGGRMEHVSRSPGYFSDPSGIQPGATATSLPLVGGLITRADLRRGVIDHALAMAIPSTRYAVWSKPAQRSDGGTQSDTAIPAGARFRLDPKLDIEALRLPPFTAMMARAAQRYGIYVRDTSPTVTFYAEDPAAIGSDPWPAAIKPSSAEVLRRFPWERLQVMRMELWTYSNRRVPR